MEEMNAQCLVGLEVAVLRGIDVLKKSVENISEFGDILAISSIIRSSKIQGMQNPDPHIYVVLKIVTDKSASEVVAQLLKIEEYFLKEYFSKNFKALLLTHSELMSLTPSLLIPHPKLAQSKSFLIGAVEVWGQYQHPILNKSLQSLLNENDMQDVEFIAQGKLLITSSKSNLSLV